MFEVTDTCAMIGLIKFIVSDHNSRFVTSVLGQVASKTKKKMCKLAIRTVFFKKENLGILNSVAKTSTACYFESARKSRGIYNRIKNTCSSCIVEFI